MYSLKSSFIHSQVLLLAENYSGTIMLPSVTKNNILDGSLYFWKTRIYKTTQQLAQNPVSNQQQIFREDSTKRAHLMNIFLAVNCLNLRDLLIQTQYLRIERSLYGKLFRGFLFH